MGEEMQVKVHCEFIESSTHGRDCERERAGERERRELPCSAPQHPTHLERSSSPRQGLGGF